MGHLSSKDEKDNKIYLVEYLNGFNGIGRSSC